MKYLVSYSGGLGSFAARAIIVSSFRCRTNSVTFLHLTTETSPGIVPGSTRLPSRAAASRVALLTRRGVSLYSTLGMLHRSRK